MRDRNIEDIYKLSPMQQGMLFHTLYAPTSGIYCQQLSCSIEGALDRSAFEHAWQRVIERHPILRTAFYWQNLQEPQQVVQRQVSAHLEQLDWRAVSLTDRQTQLNDFLDADRQRGFDLSRPPLLRLTLIRLDESSYYFIWTHHHLLLDGWCRRLVLNEVFMLYEALRQGRDVHLERPRSYRDYIAWLRRQDLARAETFWRGRLKGFLAPTPLRVDRPATSQVEQPASYAEQEARLPASMGASLRTMARKHHLTLNTIVQGAWALLLNHYSGEEDVVFGVTVSGRPATLAGVETMIGLFINTLPVRTRIDPTEVLVEWLRKHQEEQAELHLYEYSPLAQVQSWSEVARGLPLFESIVVFENYPSGSLGQDSNAHLQLHSVRSVERSNYPLTCVVAPDTELLLRLSYDCGRFESGTITRMLGHLQTLLEGMVANPRQRLVDVPILTPAERRMLLAAGPSRTFVPDRQLHEWFEARAAQAPDAVAAVYEDQHLTYGALNARSNQLAHHLRALGVGPDVRVGICAERSLDLVIGPLAILKAGGAYVPLDLASPAERLAFMIDDAQVALLLTQRPLARQLPALTLQMVYLDDFTFSEYSTANPVNTSASANLAYIIYTSGSTGKPKGVMIAHSNVVRLLQATQEWFRFDQRDVWTLFHSYAFDFSVWEIWGALCYGGRLVIVPYWVSRSPEVFYRLVYEQQVTVLNQTPSAFRQFIQADQAQEPEGRLALRLVVFGGEALELQSLAPWFGRHGDQRPQLVNMYGITETTVHVTYRPLTIEDVRRARGSTIGVPIADLQGYVLDRYQRPAPIGVPGELYIGGAGLARGYFNSPELTAERFVPNPLMKVEDRGLKIEDSHLAAQEELSSILYPLSSTRLYRTGDLVRYLPNGDMEYLGRIDHQVKIRGFRIELGEIEAVLVQHPAVQAAVALVREEPPGHRQLVAYVVPATEDGGWKIEDGRAGAPEGPSSILHPPSSILTELRSFLKRRLPEYMIPVDFVPLAVLPLTANGKIDRRALPAPARTRPDQEKVFVAPGTIAEQTLAEIWAATLRREIVGIHDNFFELGGDSILSIQIVAQARAQGLHFTLQQLFQHPTIYELCHAIAPAANDTASTKRTVPFELVSEKDRPRLPGGLEDAYPLTKLQLGMLFHSAYNPDAAIYHNLSSFHLRAPFEEGKLRTAIANLLARHPVLRTSFNLTEFSTPLQFVHQAVPAPLLVDDLRHLPAEQQEGALARWLEAEKLHHFDWSRPPLLRFHVHRRGEETFQLTLIEHHAILDGWSVATMLTELFREYLALVQGTAPTARPAPQGAFRDFVALEQEIVADQDAQEYWTTRLRGSAVAQLPRWPAAERGRAGQLVCAHEVPVSAALSAELHRLAQSMGVSIKHVLLAAHLRVLGLFSGQSDVVTGLVSNGRPDQEDSERILGLFLNTLPLRVHVAGRTWRELIRAVFEAEGNMLPFRRYPLVEIQKLQQGRPLFETAFNYIHFHVYQRIMELDSVELLGRTTSQGTNFPLMVDFSLDPATARVQLFLNYNSAEFPAEQAAALGRYYALALETLAGQPDAPAAHGTLVDQERLLIETWNATRKDYLRAGSTCLHNLCESMAERTPNQLAVIGPWAGPEQAHAVDNNRQILTYQQLNTQANQLAHHLRRMGVGPDVCVAVCMERSLELVVALLGILKAGGAYVPLDSTYPSDRLAFMLADSRAPVLLAHSHLLERLPRPPARVICLDTDQDAIARERTDNPISGVHPENLAYVIYTSGSTGSPKAAMNTHRGVVNRLLWMQDAYGLTADDRVLQKTPFSFDVSVWEFFWPLLTGACLVVARPGGHQDSAYLVDLIASRRVTTLHFVPAMLQVFLEEQSLARCTSLRRVICSGEALPFELQERFFARLNAELHNLYGPTEAAIDVTAWACKPDETRRSVPIGRPIANTQIYVLDEHLLPVPIGVPGELYIGGVNLARGYLDRPDLTAERFIPNPFTERGGEGERGREGEHIGLPSLSLPLSSSPLLPLSSRLYKTGDLARFAPDGAIEYLGRLDHQVKLRGFRIELGEIEATLHQHAGVREAIVMARNPDAGRGEDAPAGKRLVAYLIPVLENGGWKIEDGNLGTAGQPSSILHPPSSILGELRTFLQERLPDYMVPAAFVWLAAFPLTPNGKVDRRALPAPDSGRPSLDVAFMAPRTSEERALAEIWSAVLGVDRIGVNDNFFALGGDSIRSIRILAMARERDLNLSLQQLLRYPTIAELARVLRAEEAGAIIAVPSTAPFSLISAEDRRRLPDDVEDAYPLAALQAGMLFHSAYSPGSAVYHNVNSFHLHTPFDLQKIEIALQQLIARHPVLRTSFDLSNYSEPLQLVHRNVAIPLWIADLRHLTPSEQQAALVAWMEREKQHKFDWTRAPLVRFQVHRRSEETFQLSWTEHHAILDGWSVASMNAELGQIYHALLNDAASSLPPPPATTYRDFVALERQALRSEEYRRYWLGMLSDSTVTTIPRWPIDPHGAGARQIRSHDIALPEAVCDSLKRLARTVGAPLKSVLLAAHMRVLSLLSGQSDVLTGLVANGRPEATDGERILGLFLNSLPFRMRLAGGSWIDLIRATFAAEQEALAFRWYPMVEVQRSLGGQPLFEALFTFINFHVLQNLHNMSNLRRLESDSYIETNYDLAVYFILDLDSQIHLRLDHDPTVFCNDQIEAMGDYYVRVLTEMTGAPQRHYETCALLSAQEYRRLLLEWNAPLTYHPQGDCLQRLFEAQAARTPANIAVAYENQRISYQELNERANQLAHYLRQIGVGPEVRAAICMERSAELLIGLLGILKAGGAYVPLDPAYPAERLAFMLEDAQAPILLTQERLIAGLPKQTMRVVCLDSDWAAIGKQSAANPDSGVSPDHPAYVIYTSGSTGRPKGVVVTHRNVVRLFSATEGWFHFGERDVWTLFHSYAFDFSVWEIWGPLLYGGRLVVVPYWVSRSPEAFYELICEEQVTVLNQTPSAFRQLMRAEEESAAREGDLRLVIFGGEALELQSLRPWFERHGDQRPQLVNMYGITETTVHVTYRLLNKADLDGASRSAIGAPIPDLRVYILDRHMQPVPIGTPGEIYVGGAGLARGYLDRPGLTAERFVPNPFARIEDGGWKIEDGDLDAAEMPSSILHPPSSLRLYKTGDLARYLPNGDIEYLGRIDQQVKIHGYRIELGEVEATLSQHPALRESVVMVREAPGGEKRMVAYVVPAPHYQFAEDEVGAALHEEQIAQWQTVFEDTYARPAADPDPTFNIGGWDSSYTGEALPPEEMREWVDSTVTRISALRPRRVLEIGCGTGLLLFRIAPGCNSYVGTDFSSRALQYIQRQLDESAISNVALLQRAADDFSDMADESFDVVILNSVVQYFPSIEYLLRVLEGAARAVAQGGFIFLGDIRSLPLLETFHTSVQLHQATGASATATLQQQVQKRLIQENELVIAPDFFNALLQHLPRISHADILVKHGRYHNELTKFRYDVVLHVGRAAPHPQIRWIDWGEEQLTLSAVRELLQERAPDLLGIAGVPNARLRADLRAVELLGVADRPSLIADLRTALGSEDLAPLIDPEDFWALSQDLPYAVELSWSSAYPDGRYDVVLRRSAADGDAIVSIPARRTASSGQQAWSAYANVPLRDKMTRALAPELRRFLADRLPEYMIPAAFVSLDTLPLTPSGKIDRRALPDPTTSRPDIEKAYVPPANPTEQTLADIWARVLGVDCVGTHDSFFELGGDSILSIQITARARQAGIQFTPRQLFEQQTIAGLAAVASIGTTTAIVAEQELVSGPVALTPIQHWFFEQQLASPHHFNQALLLELLHPFDPALLERVVRHLLAHHDALRLRFECGEAGWHQRIEREEVQQVFTRIDLSALAEPERQAALESAATALQASLNLEQGPILRFALIDYGMHQPGLLLIVIHHLATDGVSWRVLLEDIQTAYRQLSQGQVVQLPPKTTSVKYWAERLAAYAQSSDLKQELAYWSAASRAHLARLPIDQRSGINSVGSAQTISVALSVEETLLLLQEVPKSYHTQINDALLAALGMAFTEWTKAQTLLIDLEGHGRENLFDDIDLSRTVGWFTTIFPVLVDIDPMSNPGDILKSLKEQLRCIPQHGIGYGILRYLSVDAEIAHQLQSLPQAEVSFNYLGQLDQTFDEAALFKLAQGPVGPVRSPQGVRRYLLEINALVVGGRLQVNWTYSQHVHQPHTIKRLAHSFLDGLRALITHCLSSEAGGYTPSDFPDVALSQESLDKALTEIGLS